MERAAESFEFRECINILRSTGRKAANLRELREGIAAVGDESIFHHMHQYFLKGHMMEYTNDFAHWAGESLEERALSEQLSNIDPYAYRSIGELRNSLVATMDDYLGRFPEPKDVMPGNEFYFNRTITLIFPSDIRVKNLAEFLIAVKYVDGNSIYYHFYEARMRLGGRTDDFSRWFEDVLGKKELAERIRSIDLFMHTIEGIRNRIAAAVEEEVRRDMYGSPSAAATVF